MKRSALMRRTPLRAKSRTRHKSQTSYSKRVRHWAWMLAVKFLPCCLWFLGECDGEVEADHAGDRGLGHKSPDNTCIPLCTRHHRDRTDMTGYFKSFDSAQMRDWRHARVNETQVTLIARGIPLEPPTVEEASSS